MKLIFKYLKPYFLVVLAIIVFTVVQVQTELTLPDFMSRIVTNGIQYGGITDTVPRLISKTDMNNIISFVDEKDRQSVLDCYEEVSAGSTYNFNNIVITLSDNTYILNNDNDNLINILQMPLVNNYMITQGISASDLDDLQDNYASIVKLHIKQLYENVGLVTGRLQTNYILRVGLMMLFIAGIGVLAQIASTYLATKTSARVAARMRKDVFEKVESFSSSEYSRFSTSSLITRTGNDISKVQQLIQMMLRMMLMSPIMGITAIVKVLAYPSISWLLIVAIGIMIATMIFLIIFAIPKFEIVQKLTDKINSIMREVLDGILVIRAFNSQKVEEEKFDEINSEFRRIDLFVSNLMNIISPIMTLIMNGLTVMITWFAAKQIDIDVMTIGDMMAFSQYAIHVVMSFMFVTMLFFMIPRSLVSVKRIKEVLDTENTILDIDNPIELPKENGELVFDNVSFKYPNAEECVLEDISFTAKPAETVAIIGSTGSGKSTIVKLIPRLFDVSSGRISYCGEDIRNVSQKQLHEKIGYASQNAILFTGDIKSNIEFGRDLSEEELNKAIRISQSENIIKEKTDGINEMISQGGTNVSGGQKQRLSIARALAQDKNIYIFDDCFSALDYETDKKLRAALNELIEKTKATVLIVAQRISTIKNADKIIVLDNGKIVGEGKHQDLLKSCEVYQQIAYSQLSKEELA